MPPPSMGLACGSSGSFRCYCDITPTRADGRVGNDKLCQPIKLRDLVLDAGDASDLRSIEDLLVADLVLHPIKSVLHVVTQFPHLANGIGIGIAKFDLCLQFADSRLLLCLVAVDERTVSALVSVPPAAEDVAKTAVQEAYTESGCPERNSCVGFSIGRIMILIFHSRSPFFWSHIFLVPSMFSRSGSASQQLKRGQRKATLYTIMPAAV